MKTFDFAVLLRMDGCRIYLLDPDTLKVRPERVMVEFAPIIAQEFFREASSGKVIFSETVGDCEAAFIRNRVAVDPARKEIKNGENVFIAFWAFWKWTRQIGTDKLCRVAGDGHGAHGRVFPASHMDRAGGAGLGELSNFGLHTRPDVRVGRSMQCFQCPHVADCQMGPFYRGWTKARG